MAVLTERRLDALARERTSLELSIAAAQQIDGPHKYGASGAGHAVDDPLVHVPVRNGVDLKPVRLASRLGDLVIGLRALMRLHLQNASGARRPCGTAFARRVIGLEAGHRAQEERRVPSSAEELDRRVEPGCRLGTESPRRIINRWKPSRFAFLVS